MASDMVVALGRATSDGTALFGHNSSRPALEAQVLVRQSRQAFAAGEVVQTRGVEIPQARHTWSLIAGRPLGMTGFVHGVNENGVAAGLTSIRTRLPADAPGLDGPDLVCLVLERASCTRQAVDLVTDLISRHGQGAGSSDDGEPAGCALLVVDGREAAVVEASGSHWAVQEVREVRAVTGMCQIRQDWDRISRGPTSVGVR